jgi:hypothetical protein
MLIIIVVLQHVMSGVEDGESKDEGIEEAQYKYLTAVLPTPIYASKSATSLQHKTQLRSSDLKRRYRR